MERLHCVRHSDLNNQNSNDSFIVILPQAGAFHLVFTVHSHKSHITDQETTLREVKSPAHGYHNS